MNFYIYYLSKLARILGYDFNERKDERVIKMLERIKRLGGIEFKIEYYPDGEWVAESVNIDGIVTGGKVGVHDVHYMIKDAMFAYFDIPPYLCNDDLIEMEFDDKPATMVRRALLHA